MGCCTTTSTRGTTSSAASSRLGRGSRRCGAHGRRDRDRRPRFRARRYARLVPSTSASEALVALPPVRRRMFWTLGLGAFGLAFSLTTTAAYLPPLLSRFTDSGGLIGAILGAEGVFALVISPVIGPWSDSFHTPMGRRRPFMLVALGPIGFSLLLMPFMPNLWTTVVVVMTFFFAYYIYETPYRGLYPDVLSADSFGRSQGIQHIERGIALGLALVGGGLLFKLWKPSPFLLAAVLTTTACSLVILL